MKNIKGNVCGIGEPPNCTGEDCEDSSAFAFLCDDQTGEPDETLPTVYFGTWSYKYSSSDSKKQAKDNSYIYGKFPNWAF